MKKQLQIPTFLSLVIRFSVIFLIVVMAIEMIFEWFKSGNLNAVIHSFDDNTWLTYILIKLVIALVYGVLMAYLTKKRLKKQKRG
jgi:undecaprenyl pyrophosphate phosphatase UppP